MSERTCLALYKRKPETRTFSVWVLIEMERGTKSRNGQGRSPGTTQAGHVQAHQ